MRKWIAWCLVALGGPGIGCRNVVSKEPVPTAAATPPPGPTPPAPPAPPVSPAAPRAAGAPVGNRVAPFSAELVDLSGDAPRVAEHLSGRTGKPTAYVIVGTTCPATMAYADRMRELAASYRGRGVDIVFVYPNRSDTPERKRTFHRERRFGAPMIDDRGGRVARLLGATRTSEVILTDKEGTIFYRGAIDDSRDAANVKRRHVAIALDEHLAGKPVTVAVSDVVA